MRRGVGGRRFERRVRVVTVSVVASEEKLYQHAYRGMYETKIARGIMSRMSILIPPVRKALERARHLVVVVVPRGREKGNNAGSGRRVAGQQVHHKYSTKVRRVLFQNEDKHTAKTNTGRLVCKPVYAFTLPTSTYSTFCPCSNHSLSPVII